MDEYDSEARWYYPAIMRTTTLDPLAEKYYNISPYAWCLDNPVIRIDPDGRFVPLIIAGVYFAPEIVAGAVIVGTAIAAASYKIYEHYKDQNSNEDSYSDYDEPTTHVDQAKKSPELKNQEKQDRENKQELDQNQANVAQGMDNNGYKNNKDDNNEGPKRSPKGVAAAALGVGAGIIITETILNPDPSKDAQDAWKEKVEGNNKKSSNSKTSKKSSDDKPYPARVEKKEDYSNIWKTK